MRELYNVFPDIKLIVTGITGVEISGQLKIMDFLPFKDIALNNESTQIIPVQAIIENDINAATFGFTTTQEKHVLAGLYFPENFPPGASLIVNDTIFHGSNHLSGEIKHLPNLAHLQFPITPQQVKEVVTAAIQAVIAMYDPHAIILFIPKSWHTFINQKEIIDQLTKIFTYGVLPTIHFSQDFT